MFGAPCRFGKMEIQSNGLEVQWVGRVWERLGRSAGAVKNRGTAENGRNKNKAAPMRLGSRCYRDPTGTQDAISIGEGMNLEDEEEPREWTNQPAVSGHLERLGFCSNATDRRGPPCPLIYNST